MAPRELAKEIAAQDYLGWLPAQGREVDALKLLTRCLLLDPAFRPLPPIAMPRWRSRGVFTATTCSITWCRSPSHGR